MQIIIRRKYIILIIIDLIGVIKSKKKKKNYCNLSIKISLLFSVLHCCAIRTDIVVNYSFTRILKFMNSTLLNCKLASRSKKYGIYMYKSSDLKNHIVFLFLFFFL